MQQMCIEATCPARLRTSYRDGSGGVWLPLKQYRLTLQAHYSTRLASSHFFFSSFFLFLLSLSLLISICLQLFVELVQALQVCIDEQ